MNRLLQFWILQRTLTDTDTDTELYSKQVNR